MDQSPQQPKPQSTARRVLSAAMNMSDLTKVESQMGGTIGMLIGVFGAGVMIVFFTEMNPVFKCFSALGIVSSLLMMSTSLIGLIQMRKQIIAGQEHMKKLMEEMKSMPAKPAVAQIEQMTHALKNAPDDKKERAKPRDYIN